MNQQTVTLLAAVVASIVSVASLLLNSRFTLDRERRLVVWRKEVDRAFALEEFAGSLVESIASYEMFGTAEVIRYNGMIGQLEEMGGRMARYPEVLQSTRDVCQCLKILLHDRAELQRVGDGREQLDASHRRLIEACDRVLGRPPI